MAPVTRGIQFRHVVPEIGRFGGSNDLRRGLCIGGMKVMIPKMVGYTPVVKSWLMDASRLGRLLVLLAILASVTGRAPAAPRLVARDWPETDNREWIDLGVCGGFYRNTQLQGHLVANGLHLEGVPEFWTKGSDFPYQKRGSEQEVFFVDHFSVTRFLGGYPQQWNHGGAQLPANDLAYRDESGKIRVRTELIGPRLQRYIDNGYAEFTIGIENVPWALSRDPAKSGPYGSTEPPRDWKEWGAFVEEVCRGIKDAYPPEVTAKLRFKIGNEYNGNESFTGNHDDYLRYYRESAAAIRKVFPKAPLMPGEFAGAAREGSNGVDYIKLFKQLSREPARTAPAASAIVRSCHSFPAMKDIGPRERVESAVGSFREVLDGTPRSFRESLSREYSQYGVLGSDLGAAINDTGVRSASWQFQVMFRARGAGQLDRCWAWDKSEKIAVPGRSTHFLNGIGWLYAVLDQLRGDRAWLVGPAQPPESVRDVSAAIFTKPDRIVVVLASWAPKGGASGEPETVELRLSQKDLPFAPDAAKCRTVALDDETSVAGRWRRDLAAAGNLRPEFAEPTAAPAVLAQMAKDPAVAAAMVFAKLGDYEAIQQQSLTLKSPADGLVEIDASRSSAFVEMRVLLRPNDLRVLVFSAAADR